MTKQVTAIVLGVALIAAVVIAATTGGISKDSVPSGDVATVDGTGISQADYDSALKQVAAAQNVTTLPQPGDPQYTMLRDAAIGQVLDQAWIEGEAGDKGIVVSDRQIEDQLATTKQQNFKTEAEYQAFIEKSGFTQDDVNERIKLQLLSDALQKQITAKVPMVSQTEAEDFYVQNRAQFAQPETRDIRLILNMDAAKVDEAKKALEADPSDANWNKVAAEFSTDAATNKMGGARAAITPGVLEGDLDAAVFDAPLNQIEGPVTTSLGTYIFEVTKVTPATTQPFSQVSAQLVQQLQSQKQQEIFTDFIADYRSKWADVTICADGFVIDRCDNFKGTTAACPPADVVDKGDKAVEDYLNSTGCPPVVNSRAPIGPGTASALASAGAPQRPHPAGSAAPTTPGVTGVPATGGATGAGGSAAPVQATPTG